MKHLNFLHLIVYITMVVFFIALFSCKTLQTKTTSQQPVGEVVVAASEPANQQSTNQEQQIIVQEQPKVEVYATEEEKKEALFDIKDFIFKLNKIVQRKDFEAWYSYLTADYVAYYSNPDVLAEISSQPTLRKYNIVLKSLKDYFLYVVYPSRQNDTVDEIEYIGYNRVKVYTYVNNVKLVLYVLEKIDGKWMISR